MNNVVTKLLLPYTSAELIITVLTEIILCVQGKSWISMVILRLA